MKIIGIALLVLGLLGGFVAWSTFADAKVTEEVTIPAKPRPTPTPASTAGHDTPNSVCGNSNGWSVCPPAKVDSATFIDFLRRYSLLLGEAIGPYNPGIGCQPFANSQLCFGGKAGYEMELGNSGGDALKRLNQPPRRSEPHPAVAAWIKSLEEGGIEPIRGLGNTLSAAACSAGNTCQQFFDKVVVVFPKDATSGDEVRLVPVEQLRLYPTPPQEPDEPSRIDHRESNLPWDKNLSLMAGLGISILIGVAGGGLLVYGLINDDEM